MLLLLVLGKHNGARLRPDSALAQQPNPPIETLKSHPTGGSGPRLAGLVAP